MSLMAGWKKFLLIPMLVLFYIIFIDWLVSSNFSASVPSQPSQASGSMLTIGVGQAVEVSVMRPYLFGLVRLPVYSASLGDISFLHETFFYFIIALAIVFILMEKFRSREVYKFQRRGYDMAGFHFNPAKFLRAAMLGLGVGILSFILSGDGGPSVALGLLLIYLEYRLK